MWNSGGTSPQELQNQGLIDQMGGCREGQHILNVGLSPEDRVAHKASNLSKDSRNLLGTSVMLATYPKKEIKKS